MHIRFREDFSKEDRDARSKLWPLVQEARKKGKRAFLKEDYALIDNRGWIIEQLHTVTNGPSRYCDLVCSFYKCSDTSEVVAINVKVDF